MREGLTLPEVIAAFTAYYARPGHGAWGDLHVVLCDGNVRDADVTFCRDLALEHGDREAVHLAGILLRLSRTQRIKLPQLVYASMRATKYQHLQQCLPSTGDNH